MIKKAILMGFFMFPTEARIVVPISEPNPAPDISNPSPLGPT